MDGLENLERHDGFAQLRNVLREIADKTESWAGIPMPLDGQRLVIEQTFPRAKELEQIYDAVSPPEKDNEEDDYTFRNSFWSWKFRSDVSIFQHKTTGKLVYGPTGYARSSRMQLFTLGASDAWGIEQESNALQTLATLLPHRQFKQYLLVGMFMERSKRSGLHYLFRKLRPTLVFHKKSHNKEQDSELAILCALCLHPIAYYQSSWAGAMCPTDDVIAHLMMMRGDEHMFWKRSNQHPAWRTEAGI